jgi:hypothetical protein
VPVWNTKIAVIFADISDEYKCITAPAEITQETCGEQERISISGFRVDTVESGVLQYFDITGKLNDEDVERIQALLRVLAHCHSPEAIACTFGNADKGKSLDYDRIAAFLSDYHAFMQWEPTLSGAVQTPSDGGCVARVCHRFLHDRVSHSLFLTQLGMLGLGPSGMRADDVVVVLHGASVPFVLRPAEDSLWRLVGECYVYDVNDGSVVRKWKEKGGISETFCIY